MRERETVIPWPVVRRLIRYHACVQARRADGARWVSSEELAERLGLTRSTVRQDFLHLRFAGGTKRGYEIEALEDALARTLGADCAVNVAIVGAGNLGRALVLRREFEEEGFRFCAIFDADPRLEGTRVGRLTVQGMGRLSQTVAQKGAVLGAVAVPPSAAQDVAEALIAAGVRGVLNFASIHLKTPEDIPVVDVRIVASLRELSYAVLRRGESGPGISPTPSARPQG